MPLRNRSIARAAVMLATAALLFTALPLPTATAQAESLWDFRITEVRAVTKNQTTFATHGWFPEAGKQIQLYVYVKTFRSSSPLDTETVEYKGQFRVKAFEERKPGGEGFETLGGCQKIESVTIPKAGKEFLLTYNVPSNADLTYFNFTVTIHEQCTADSYAPSCCTVGDEPANNRKVLQVRTGVLPDFAILPTTYCWDACGPDHRSGGPGLTLDPDLRPQSAVAVDEAPVQMCYYVPDLTTDPHTAPTSWKHACPSPYPYLTLDGAEAEGDKAVYFRVNVSYLKGDGAELHWDTATETDPDTQANPGGADSMLYGVYPDAVAGDPATPILVPVEFELWRVTEFDDSRPPIYTYVKDLRLADFDGTPVAPNCPLDQLQRRCIKWLATADRGTPAVWTESLDLYNRGGKFQLRVHLNGHDPNDPAKDYCGDKAFNNGPVPDATCANNYYAFEFEVKAPDLEAKFTTPQDLSTKYKVNDKLELDGFLINNGSATVQAAPEALSGSSYDVLFYIDDKRMNAASLKFDESCDGDAPASTPNREQVLAEERNLDPDETCPFSVELNMNTGDAATAVAPGTRVARLWVDAGEDIKEIDNADNNATWTFIVEDTQAPVLDKPGLLNHRGKHLSGTPEINRGQAFTVRVNVTDTDHSITDVKLQLTPPSNNTLYACTECPALTQIGRSGDVMLYEVTLEDGLLQLGEWTLKVRAADPSGGVGLSTERKFKIIPFQKDAEFEYTDYEPNTDPGLGDPGTEEIFPSNHSVLPFLDAQGSDYGVTPRWKVESDPRDETGFEPAWTSKPYKIRLTPPDGNWTEVSVEDDAVLFVEAKTGETTRIGNGHSGIEGPRNFSTVTAWDDSTCEAGTGCARRTGDTEFKAFRFSVADIGTYNLTLNVTDVGNESKVYWTIFHVRDEPPTGNISLLEPKNVRFVRANTNATYNVTGLDDQGFDDNGTVHLNFTRMRADWTVDRWVNVSMGKHLGDTCGTTDAGLYECLFSKKVKIANSRAGGDLTKAGRWNLTVHLEDKWGNFANLTEDQDGNPLYVLVNDTRAAQLTAFGTSQPEEEVGANVTFWARVTDDLDPTVLLTVKEGTNVFENEVEMTDDDNDGNWTFTRAFDAPHLLEYQVRVVDSNVSRTVPPSPWKTIQISDNLPPRVDVLVPSVPAEGYFAKAAPVLEFKVYDSQQGVDSATIRMTVDGQNVTTLERTLTEGGRGFLVKYTHDPTKPFVHGQRVNVTLAAADLSTPPKAMTTSINFTVDAIAPKSRVLSYEPAYVPDDGGAPYVSLGTRFTPASDDSEDGLPTGVKEIRYQFLRNGPGQEFVYNGTAFPMSQLPAAQNVGNAEYFVRILGVDVAGNKEVGSTSNTLRVFLDQVPPELVRSKLKISGRLLNATFEDAGSGVKAARVHYRYDAGLFAAVDMVRQADGTWTATVPVNPTAKNVCYYLEATDNVGNRKQAGDEQSPPWCVPVGNRPPTVAILAPSEGQTVSGSTTLRWEASDPDGDPLTYKVYYKAATSTNELELRTLEGATQSYVINTQTLGPDGAYDLRVTASDGHFFEQDTVRVEVLNARRSIGDHNANKFDVKPGEAFCYLAKITKQGVAVVEARVFLDGERVQTVAMADNGRDCDVNAGDGVYSAQLSLDRAGSYDVEVYVRYVEGGEAKEETDRKDGVVTLRFTAVDVIEDNPVLFGAFVAMAAAVFAVGGFAVFRRWRL